jgi:DNA polymerase-3 subunit alpha
MLDLMPETFGVMVYQEDVIKVAHYFAGLTLGEADMLRRGMSGKFRSREEFLKVKNQFFLNCKEKGYSEEMTNEVWKQVESFAGYAFAKGHSASYAIESYQSLFLKAYSPLEYMTAVINNGGGFYRTELYVHEARMHGGRIEAPCVNKSEILAVIYDKTIYLGLGFIKDLEAPFMKRILKERYENGDFGSLEDFVNRIAPPLEQLKILIRMGAFRFTGLSKKELLWEAHFILSGAKEASGSGLLFDLNFKKFEIPSLHHDRREEAFDEMELLGFPLSNPFDLLADKVEGPVILAQEMEKNLGEKVRMLGYLVATKNTSTHRGERMHFGTFIDEAGQFIDTTHFPVVSARFPFRGNGVYEITGLVVEEFDFYSLEVHSMRKLNYVNLEDEYSGGHNQLRLSKSS